ncbi:AraC family transcriptional regulator (plasmid) [Mesorhizobium sp. 131-3-5]|uniref:GlxA family transcriptional regulator n=1 Tax=Mesorhizobium sp. 131-3-5 TaxID=2744520 RepID=UPI0018ED59A8|nr:GlxA family transcriptional regulator [Mesorhizobium sp. 131-3-5]BCH12619.1 AraC family transcriptional regulator [Mesorhizobium sp. 131-3-5]
MNAPATISAIEPTEQPNDLPLDHSLKIAVLVLSGFSHLTLHAYLEPLQIANVLSKAPLFRWQVVGLDKKPVYGANGIAISVDVATEELSAYNPHLNQLVIVAGEQIGQQFTPQLHTFLRRMARRGILISALGTATWLLAETGLLTDIPCTIHWSRLAAFSEVFRKPRVRETLFVKDGQYSTCAGELAAFDLAIDLIASQAGATVAQDVCRYAIVDGQRSGSNRQTAPSGLSYANVSEKLVIAVQTMEANLDNPLSMDVVAKRSGVSRRQLERLFVTHVSLSPAKHYLKIRLDHAKRLIEGTRMPLIDIAIACGFISASHFSKCFKSIHGKTPQQCRLEVPAWVGPGLG